jgi:diguanylate cyclase (GGDEF)-like protein/PAS domain S-box-containing protein
MNRRQQQMGTGTRARGILVVLPVVAELIVLVAVGVAAPHHISHLPSTALGTLSLVVGLTSGLLAAVASARCRGRLRLSWAAMAVACAAWSASLYGAVRGWPQDVVWLGLRGSAFVAVALAIALSPRARRTPREWGLLLLDGWLVGISAFLIGYVALRLTRSSLSGTPPALYWVPFDLLIASTVTGLAMRGRGPRPTLTLLVLGALLTVTSDTTWALTVHHDRHVTPFGLLEWLIALTAFGSSTLTRHPDPWSSALPETNPDRSGPRITRLAQMAMVPGLLAAATPGAADRLTLAAAASLILGLTVEVALTRRQHSDLWSALQGQAERMEQLLQESRDALVRLDGSGRIEFANAAVAEVFGHPPRSLVGTSWYDLMLPDDRDAMAGQLSRLNDDGLASGRIAGRFRHGDGGWRELESTASRRGEGDAGFTLSVRDVSERSRLEADLRRQASTDWLTGLFNRQAFITLLEERLPRGDTHMLFLDLDGFKAVNDTDGHLAGDILLRQVGEALRAELRPGDIAARFGGDEFAILPAVRDLDGTTALASRLVARIGTLSSRNGTPIGASIGVADGYHDSAESLIRRADLAMYQAKSGGGGRYVVSVDRHRHRPHFPDAGRSAPARPGRPTAGPGHTLRPAETAQAAPALIDLTDLTDLVETEESGQPRA